MRFDENSSGGKIVAEDVEICEFEDIVGGVAVWLASYYCFNFVYPVEYRKTLTFFQKFFLGIEDNIKSALILRKIYLKLEEMAVSNSMHL